MATARVFCASENCKGFTRTAGRKGRKNRTVIATWSSIKGCVFYDPSGAIETTVYLALTQGVSFTYNKKANTFPVIKNSHCRCKNMVSLEDLAKSLTVAFESKDYESCQKLLPAIRAELIKNNLFIPDFSNTNKSYIADINITKKILEIGALSSVFALNFDNFQNLFAQLRPFYFSGDANILKSENECKIISIYLLILLSQGDITKFHAELEYLDKHIPNLEDDELISYPIKIDRWLMEGLYQKVWELLETGMNIPEFDVFNKELMLAIRDEIARSTELAYQSLPLSSIKTLLLFGSEKEAETFAIERGWEVSGPKVVFHSRKNAEDGMEDDESQGTANNNTSDEVKLIERTLDYAINLETII